MSEDALEYTVALADVNALLAAYVRIGSHQHVYAGSARFGALS
jgi:hypothetical protein